jgi:hypothetical protein
VKRLQQVRLKRLRGCLVRDKRVGIRVRAGSGQANAEE